MSEYDEKTNYKISFNFNETDYDFDLFIRWVKIHDLNENDFYINIGMGFDHKLTDNDELLELLVDLYLNYFDFRILKHKITG